MNDKYMDVALQEAMVAYKNNEVPVGAVIVRNNEIIAQTHNIKVQTNNILNHAEILALLDASKKINNWRLNDCEMYVTLEPCPMCASAIQQARIKKIYIGTKSNIQDNSKIFQMIVSNDSFNHRVEYVYLNDLRCSTILTDFFSNKR